MTAEIAIANKYAVALAADSKVTVGGVEAKTYDTVSKVFTLSKIHPVGIMVFGNAEFMGFPWETIVKLYRSSNGKIEKDLVTDWVDDFLNFLHSFGDISENDKSDNIIKLCFEYLGEAESAAYHMLEAGHFSDIESAFKITLEARLQDLEKIDDWVDTEYVVNLGSKFKDHIVKAVHHFAGQMDDDTIKRLAFKFLLAALSKNQSSNNASGLVFAGFGKTELFPSVIEYSVDGYVGDKIKLRQMGDVMNISREQNSGIRAFAQGDMVQRFMNGIDLRLFSALFTSFQQVLSTNCQAILEQYGSKEHDSDEVRDAIETAVGTAMSQFVASAEEYIDNNFAQPVIQTVALLPKDELANLAESLVALTSLKRRVSKGMETVGGPVDVALISKTDGFVWVKRKHYFPYELNRTFNEKYFRDS